MRDCNLQSAFPLNDIDLQNHNFLINAKQFQIVAFEAHEDALYDYVESAMLLFHIEVHMISAY